MIFKTGCKINLGLQILSKRADGYHNISTIFYPISALNDLIEIVPAKEDSFSSSGIKIQCPEDKNLCVIALKHLRERYSFPNCKIHLHKCIPFGAGLGAGSANAMGVIEGINELFSLGMSLGNKIKIGSEIGSDVPFFAINRPQLANGKGELLEDISVSLENMYIQVAKPSKSISTKEAYSKVIPNDKVEALRDIIKRPIKEWKKFLYNDFESSVFETLTESKKLKELFYENGAIYSAMSGSGSAVYGIFSKKPDRLPSNIILEQKL